MRKADAALETELQRVVEIKVAENELQKVKNKLESTKLFNEMSALNKAMNLCFFELLGDANMVNEEMEKYRNVNPEQIRRVANELLRKDNCSTLFYLAK